MNHTLSRRQALRAGAATLAGATVLILDAAPVGAAPKGRKTYVLDPTGGGHSCSSGRITGGCPACNACKLHAANKIFSSKKAPNSHRAHKGCLCTIVSGPTLPRPVFDALFVESDSADRRDPRVATILADGDIDTVPVPMITGAAIPAVAVAAGGLGWMLWRRNQRQLEPATAAVPAEPSDRHGDDRDMGST